MNDVVIPVLGELLPMLAACLIIAGLYYLLKYLKGVLLWYFIYRALTNHARNQENREAFNQGLNRFNENPTHTDWAWVDDAIEEFNRSIDKAKGD